MNKLNKTAISFIGAGPGDPDLLTIKGMRNLSEADIIFYDALIDIEKFKKINKKAKWSYVGKRAGKVSIDQKIICRLLVNYYRRGLNVVRLKGGDPTIFGRLTEEIDILSSNKIPYEIVPGISAGQSCAAELGVSLTERNVSRSICFLTPSVSKNSAVENEWLKSVLNCQTSVLYMAGKQIRVLGNLLIKKGMSPDMPVAIIENTSRESKKVITQLAELNHHDKTRSGPVCIVIGEILKNHFHDEKPVERVESRRRKKYELTNAA